MSVSASSMHHKSALIERKYHSGLLPHFHLEFGAFSTNDALELPAMAFGNRLYGFRDLTDVKVVGDLGAIATYENSFYVTRECLTRLK